MNHTLRSESYGPFVWKPALLNKFKGFILKGSQPYSYSGDFGSVLVQEFISDLFTIRYITLEFFRKMVVHWKEENSLKIQFVLSSEMNYKRNGTSIVLEPSSYNLVWAPGRETIAHFSKGKVYRLFNAYFSLELVQRLIPAFLDLQHTENEKQSFWIEPEINKAVYGMLQSPYEGSVQEFFFENKVREILFATLLKGTRKFHPDLTEHDLSAIYAADQLILSNLDKHYTISQIARKVGINESKLKTGFKKVIGMTLYERLHTERMEKARELLLHSDKPIKAIHEEIGFEHLTNFITSFRKHFGVPPAALRRKSS